MFIWWTICRVKDNEPYPLPHQYGKSNIPNKQNVYSCFVFLFHFYSQILLNMAFFIHSLDKGIPLRDINKPIANHDISFSISSSISTNQAILNLSHLSIAPHHHRQIIRILFKQFNKLLILSWVHFCFWQVCQRITNLLRFLHFISIQIKHILF